MYEIMVQGMLTLIMVDNDILVLCRLYIYIGDGFN